MMFMRWLLSILVSLQIMLGVFGQGAITLCVRQDGTQKLHWTWLSDCHAHDHEAELANIPTMECDPCTDYAVIVDVPLPLTAKQPWLDSATICCTIILEIYVSKVPVLSLRECYGLPPPWGLLFKQFIVLHC